MKESECSVGVKLTYHGGIYKKDIGKVMQILKLEKSGIIVRDNTGSIVERVIFFDSLYFKHCYVYNG